MIWDKSISRLWITNGPNEKARVSIVFVILPFLNVTNQIRITLVFPPGLSSKELIISRKNRPEMFSLW